jgi:hypothetical protein
VPVAPLFGVRSWVSRSIRSKAWVIADRSSYLGRQSCCQRRWPFHPTCSCVRTPSGRPCRSRCTARRRSNRSCDRDNTSWSSSSPTRTSGSNGNTRCIPACPAWTGLESSGFSPQKFSSLSPLMASIGIRNCRIRILFVHRLCKYGD